MNKQGLLLVISGPSGAGKGTICQALLKRDARIKLSVSCTTRAPRGKEQDGVSYYFLTRETFEDMIAADEFLEWANVYGNYYGTPKRAVQDALATGVDVILEIDPQGALQVKEKFPAAVLIFIVPPSFTELKNRIVHRATDAPEVIQARLACAADELSGAVRYDYLVLNDSVDRAVELIQSIIMAEQCRPQRFDIHQFLAYQNEKSKPEVVR